MRTVTTETEWSYPGRKLGMYHYTMEGDNPKERLIVFATHEEAPYLGWADIRGEGDVHPVALELLWSMNKTVVLESFREASGKKTTDWENAQERDLFEEIEARLSAIRASTRLVKGAASGEDFASLFRMVKVSGDITAFVHQAMERMKDLEHAPYLAAKMLKETGFTKFTKELFEWLGEEYVAEQLDRLREKPRG